MVEKKSKTAGQKRIDAMRAQIRAERREQLGEHATIIFRDNVTGIVVEGEEPAVTAFLSHLALRPEQGAVGSVRHVGKRFRKSGKV